MFCQLVKDRPMEARVGPQIKSTSRVRGTPTIRSRRSLSCRVRTVYRRLRRVATRAPAAGAFCVRAGARPVVVLATAQIILSALALWRQRVPERLHLALQTCRVALRVGKEREQEALHAVRSRKVGTRVAVEILRDLLRAGHELHGLLIQRAVPAGVSVACGRDRSRSGLGQLDLCRTLGPVLEESLGLTEILAERGRFLADHDDVDRRVDALLGVVLGSKVWERKEIQLSKVVRVARGRELLGYEQTKQVHAGLLPYHLVRPLLPGCAGET